IIIAVEVIEHVRNPWDFLGGLKRLAGERTHILVTTPHVSHWWGRRWFFLTGTLWRFTPEGWDDPGHLNPLTRVGMEGIGRDLGLEGCDVWAGGSLPVIWGYNWKRLLLSLAMLPLRPLMRGDRDGFNLCYHLRCPTSDSPS